MFENFPFTDMHQLNLDWIIKIAKDFLDQYTHLQELITNGENSLTTLTETGEERIGTATTEALADLQEKYNALETLLDAWYNTHSADIAAQLSNAITSFQNTAATIAASVIESIPEDYTELSNSVTQLQNLFSGGVFTYGYYALDRGGILASSGSDIDPPADNRAKTPFIPGEISSLKTSGAYEFLVYAYNLNNTYVGALDGNGNWTTTPGQVAYTTEYVFNHNNYKFRIVFRKNDNSDFATADPYQYITFFTNVDTSLTKNGVPANGYTTGNRIKELFVSRPTQLKIMDLSDFGTFNIGAINASGEIVTTAAYQQSLYSPRFAIVEGQKVSLVCRRLRTVDTQYISICFYDSSNAFISRVISAGNAESISANAPENAAWFRVSLNQIIKNSCAEFNLSVSVDNPFMYTSSTESVRMFIFGDSISAGYYSLTDEEAAETGATIIYRPDGLSGVGAAWDRSLGHNYWGYANQKLGFNITNKAYPAQGFLKTDGNDENGMILVDSTDLSNADLIVFALGFNDWHYQMPKGNHTAPEDYPYNTSISDITTINQAIWYTLGRAAIKAPNATIIVQTPMNGWLYGGDFASNWGMGASLPGSGTLSGIVDDIKYWADYYGFQVLDLSTNNSTINRMNIKTTELDGSHPTDKAHKQLGHKVAQALMYR